MEVERRNVIVEIQSIGVAEEEGIGGGGVRLEDL